MTFAARLWAGIGVPALLMAAGSGVAAATSGHDDQHVALAVVSPIVGLSFVGAGLLGWTRSSENGTGRLLVMVGLLWFVSAFWEANDRALFTLGSVFGSLFLAAFVHLVLAYPRGRLESRMHGRLIGALYGVALAAGLMPTLFGEGSCTDCPDSAITIVDSTSAYDAVQLVFTVIGLVVFLGVVALLVRRWHRSTAAARRLLAPVYLSGGVALGLIGTSFALDIGSDTAGGVAAAAAFTVFGLVPFFFVGGLLRMTLRRAQATRLLLEVPDEPTAEEAQAGLRRALGDPTLQLLTWVDETQAYVDIEGNFVHTLPEGFPRASTPIEYEGRRLAAIVHEPALRHEPELLAQVTAIARVALEKDRGLQALRRAEARTRALLDAIPDLMFRISREGVYLDANAGDATALVVPREELLGKNVRDYLPPNIADSFMRSVEGALRGNLQTFEYQLDLGGRKRDFEARMVPAEEDEVVVIVRDFTTRLRLEAELASRLEEIQRAQEFTRRVVNAGPSLFLLVDTDGRIVRFNDTVERMFGVRDDERVRGLPWWDVFLPPENREAAQNHCAQLGSGTEQIQAEAEWQSPDGVRRVIDATAIRVVDDEGNTRYLICGQDVTERIHQQEELRAQRDFLSVIARATPSLLAVVEADGTIAEEGVNPAFAAATGYADEHAIGRRFWNLVVAPEYVGEVQRHFKESVATRTPVEYETTWIGHDGGRRLIAWTCRPIPLVGEKYLLSGLDVTQRKNQEAELRASRARIVEAGDEERCRLERNLHDGAQQRLVALSLTLRLAQFKARTDPDAAEKLLEGAGEELSHALEELRELARGIHPAVLSDRGLSAALETLAARAPVPVDLSTQLDERLPGPVEAAAYYVVSEALTNVAKYAKASSVRVNAARQNGRVVVEVADDGVGGADPGRGSGLRGLIDRIEALDGQLEVESRTGGGTCVRAVIPLPEEVDA
jgi:PAS domain S-box-containing protein